MQTKKEVKINVRSGPRGKTWKLCITKSWERLFVQNEKSGQHKTDRQLAETMKKEFPSRKAKLFSADGVSKMRSQFNRDRMSMKRDNENRGIVSHAYTEKGQMLQKHQHRFRKAKLETAKLKPKEQPKQNKIVIIKKKKK